MSALPDPHPQDNGTRWFKSRDSDHGWTTNPAYAHPDYTPAQLADTTQETPPMIDTPDAQPRTTPLHGFPLPPPPPRAEMSFNSYGQYKVPSPSTGRTTAYSRATTVADTLDDTYRLNMWKQRNAAAGMLSYIDAQAAVDLGSRGIGAAQGKDILDVFDTPATEHDADLIERLRGQLARGEKDAANATLDRMAELAGSRRSAEWGTCVHAWCEAWDLRQVTDLDEVPEEVRPFVVAYLAVLERYSIIALPEYVERVVLNTSGEKPVIGTLDRVYMLSDETLVLGDLKTSKTLEFSYLSYGIQLANYAGAELILTVDGLRWEKAPQLRRDFSLLVQVPSDNPAGADAVTMDYRYGEEARKVALQVRRMRNESKKRVPYVHAIPTPMTDEDQARHRARVALMNISDPAELDGVWEKYQDVWTDALTEIGTYAAAQITQANAHATAQL